MGRRTFGPLKPRRLQTTKPTPLASMIRSDSWQFRRGIRSSGLMLSFITASSDRLSATRGQMAGPGTH